ncbi:hypothetical protein V6N12_057960 [Hibiscus sabdariffa]|uniref:Uncharacterized protein n=1 Tax=Hibiscus sabdariffa TaxID=183260 RepID=A0ABR2AEA4_9ROSI
MSLVPTHPLERVELYCSSVGLKGGCWCYTTPHTKAKPGLQLSKRGEIKSSSKEELTKTWPNELPNRCILYAIIRSFCCSRIRIKQRIRFRNLKISIRVSGRYPSNQGVKLSARLRRIRGDTELLVRLGDLNLPAFLRIVSLVSYALSSLVLFLSFKVDV